MERTELKALEPPLQIVQLLHSRWAVQALKSALELKVFSSLAPEPLEAAGLGKKLSLNQEGCRLLLNALCSLGFLKKQSDKYELAESARLYLDEQSPYFMGDYILDEAVPQAWSRLNESLKSGKPVNSVNQDLKAEEFFPRLAANIFPLNYGTAQLLAYELEIEKLAEGSRVLDIACGSAVWSLPLAEKNQGLTVDALDFSSVLEVTKKFTAKYGVQERYRFLSGNWSELALESAAYDLVILGHILHSEGRQRSKELLSASFAALKEGGRIVIAELISDSEHIGSPSAQLFALNMYLLTDNGCVFSEEELEKMLLEAGFQSIKRPRLPGWDAQSPLMIACK